MPSKLYTPPPSTVAALPLTVQSVRLVMPPSFRRPAPKSDSPSAIVRPEIAAEPPWMWKTRLALLPLTVSTLAPGPVTVVVAVSVSTSGPAVRVMVSGPEKAAVAKPIVSAVGRTLARLTAWGRLSCPGAEPTPPKEVLTTSAVPSLWKAPISTEPPRAKPRWSVAGAPVLVPVPIAGLPGSSAMVKVGPP